MEPQPLPPEPILAHSAIRFSPREIELAHQMRALGLDWEPAPGMFVYDEEGRFPEPSPLQEHVFFILDLDLFIRLAGGYHQLKTQWTWLPAWEDGCQWLHKRGKNNAEILDRARETSVDDGLSPREALYGLIISTLQAEKGKGLQTE